MIGQVVLAAVVVVTSPALLLTLLGVAVAAGYGLGRWRPWVRLGDWAEWQVGYDQQWWVASKPRQALVVAAYAVTWAGPCWQAWRHRNGPPRQRDPAPVIDPDGPRTRP